MAAISTIALVAVATVSTYVAVKSYQEQKESAAEAKAAQQRAVEEQRKQAAIQQAQEQRQQIREERVRRGRILQASQARGGAGSTGEFGATGGLATQLGSNVGQNLAMKAIGQQISIFNQQYSNAAFDAQQAGNLFALSSQFAGATLGKSFSAMGAAGSATKIAAQAAPSPTFTI